MPINPSLSGGGALLMQPAYADVIELLLLD
jgi:hypothetical protein